jgi:prepilin signal peptidase PulO-like enzyme (type II secretory pathway)
MFYTSIFIFGLLIGSFLNCVIWRLHKEEKITGRSYCPKCRHQLAWYENIPVFSFVFLRGKCGHCQGRISSQYPLVELITAMFFSYSFYVISAQFPISNFQFPNNFQFPISNYQFLIQLFKYFFLISIMIIIFVIDLRWYLIMDIITLPACVIIFITNILLRHNWQNLLISGIIGGSFFLMQFLISKGKWVGGGDIRMGLLMGLALGWPNIIIALMLAYFIGSIVGIALILVGKKQWGSQVPMGVFLSTATVITLFWGEDILEWYLHLLY